jgi:hypothetical protein
MALTTPELAADPISQFNLRYMMTQLLCAPQDLAPAEQLL